MTATTSQVSGARPIGALDGLRAVAAGAVVVLHVWAYGHPAGEAPARLWGLGSLMPLLALGVTLFFTLSGFLLFRPFARALLVGGPLPALRPYTRKRILRVFPAYWVILFVVAVVFPAAIVHAGGGYELTHLRSRPVTLALDAALVQGYWPDANVTGIGPAWTLVVEVAFYAALPLLAGVAARVGRLELLRRRRTLVAALPVIALFLVGWSGKGLALLLRPTVVTGATGWDNTWYSVLLRSAWVHADHFCAGMTVALLLLLPRWSGGARRVSSAALVVAAAAAVALTVSHRLGLPLMIFESAMTIPFALVLLAIVLTSRADRSPRRLASVLEWRPLVAVGAASYSLYLWHEPAVRWMAAQGWMAGGNPGVVRNLMLVAAVAGVLSAATYLIVERPLLSRRSHAGPAAETTGPTSPDGGSAGLDEISQPD